MPAQRLHLEAFVLTKRPAADPYQAYLIFSGDHGVLHVLQRISKRPAAGHVQLDLFDEAALDLESSNQGRTWFVREARLVRRWAEIGRSYEALRAASAFTLLISRNPVLDEGVAKTAALLRTALAAFATAERPEIVGFKCLYCFARDEGHPVKQQWFPQLTAADRETVAALLNRPLAEQTADADTVARLQRSLEEYLTGHTEIILG